MSDTICYVAVIFGGSRVWRLVLSMDLLITLHCNLLGRRCLSIKDDALKEDKPPNKGQAESILMYTVYTLYRKSPLKEDT